MRQGLVPDLVVITGDLAFSGTDEEYGTNREQKVGELRVSAWEWLEQELWPLLSPEPHMPLPRDRLLLVPGNHDVTRDAVNFMVLATQTALLSRCDQDQIAEVLASAAQREVLLRRHVAYLAFYSDWIGERQSLPWWRRSLEIRGQRLHLAGLDSAWMACSDADRGRLLLGRYQVHETVAHRDGDGADWRIALVHHPWDYLAEPDLHDVRPTVHLHCDLILRGHLHEPDVSRIVPPDPARACLEVAAGCVYEHSRYPNAFQWIELWPATADRPRRIRLLFRAWVKGAWQIDRNQLGCPDGVADYSLDSAVLRDMAAPDASAKPPAIPAEYLAWVGRSYGGVDLLGQDAQEGQSVSLNQVYVPAVTTPLQPIWGDQEEDEDTAAELDSASPALLITAHRRRISLLPGPSWRRQVHILPLGRSAVPP